MRSVSALASPFGRVGLPGFLGLGISILLNNRDSNGGFGGYGWRDVKDGDVSLLIRIRIMRPGIDPVRLGMAVQIEYLDYAIPDRIALIDLFHRDALDVGRGHAV
jgi:hypothetical protein